LVWQGPGRNITGRRHGVAQIGTGVVSNFKSRVKFEFQSRPKPNTYLCVETT
jgi:hypothetical protein